MVKKYRIPGYDPFEEMHSFYSKDDPTEEEQFRFVEAMEYLINTSFSPVDVEAFSYNLAMYYRDIKDFRLEKKYLEIGAQSGSDFSKEQLGIIWYYGLCGEKDYEKAFRYFEASGTRLSQYMMADMYRYGFYVAKDLIKCREILEKLFEQVSYERDDYRFIHGAKFPEIALRLVLLNLEEGADTRFDLECLFDARDILALRQQKSPFWGNIKTMKSIIETTGMMCGTDFDVTDIYDLLVLSNPYAVVQFDYNDKHYRVDVFPYENETVYQYDNKWYHGAEDFLEKAKVDNQRITTVFDLISNIKIEPICSDELKSAVS